MFNWEIKIILTIAFVEGAVLKLWTTGSVCLGPLNGFVLGTKII